MRLRLCLLTTLLVSPVVLPGQVWQPRVEPGMRGVPRMTLPDVSSDDQPTFRTSVLRVGVSALVVDTEGRPVRGLTDEDFQVLEDGRPQAITSFTAFEYQADALPVDHVPAPVGAHAIVAPASNAFTTESRLFAVLIDDLHIDARRTERTRTIVRRLIDQLTPSDLLFVGLTSTGENTVSFTRDRRRAREIVDRVAGQRLPDPMIELLRSPGSENTQAGTGGDRTPGLAASAQERIVHLERAYESIGRLAGAVAHMPGRRKTLLYVSEGSSVGATVTSMGELNVGGSANRALQQAMAAATVADVAIYPMNPAGLDTPGERLIEGRIREQDPDGLYRAHEDNSNVLSQFLQARNQLRDMAALTGGVSLVDSNDFDAGVARVLSDASDYYVLSYEPDREVKDSRLRSLEVVVKRPGVKVLARRGYIAPRYLRVGEIKTPSGLSVGLQNLLSDIVEEDDLAMKVQVVPLVERKGKTLVAVIAEVDGAPLVASSDGGKVALDQAIFSLDSRGKTANASRRHAKLTFTPAQLELLDATALRTVWAVELAPGEHQLRLAAIDEVSGRGGSVFVDVSIPKGVPPRSVIVASQALSTVPTAFVDREVGAYLSGTPTTSRVFPGDDTIEVSVPNLETPAAVRVESSSGDVVWQGQLAVAVPAARLDIPLAGLTPGDHSLVLDDGRSLPPVYFSVLPRQVSTSAREIP
jgi:VWFA-related protein